MLADVPAFRGFQRKSYCSVRSSVRVAGAAGRPNRCCGPTPNSATRCCRGRSRWRCLRSPSWPGNCSPTAHCAAGPTAGPGGRAVSLVLADLAVVVAVGSVVTCGPDGSAKARRGAGRAPPERSSSPAAGRCGPGTGPRRLGEARSRSRWPTRPKPRQVGSDAARPAGSARSPRLRKLRRLGLDHHRTPDGLDRHNRPDGVEVNPQSYPTLECDRPKLLAMLKLHVQVHDLRPPWRQFRRQRQCALPLGGRTARVRRAA